MSKQPSTPVAMINPELISVIIPVYNAAATIAVALDSVRAQSVAGASSRQPLRLEIIAVDDRSTDDSCATVENWLRRQSTPELKVKLLRRDLNQGPAGARNLGLQAARGAWIAFLDADDAWLPDRLNTQFEAIAEWQREHPGDDPVFVCGETVGVEDAGGARVARGALNQKSKIENLQLSDYAVSNPVATSTVLVRREWLRAVGGFDEQFRGPEDYDLWIRVAAKVAGDAASPQCPMPAMLRLNTPLAGYRSTAGSLSGDDERFLPQVLRVIDKAYGQGGALAGCRGKRKARAYQFLAAAWSAADRQQPMRAMRLFILSVWTWPFSFRAEKHLPWGRLKVLMFLGRRSLRRKRCHVQAANGCQT